MNVCKAIGCPFFHSHTNGYGCQRYSVSGHCHLIKSSDFVLSNNQYILCAELEDSQIESLKKRNDQFFVDDATYKEKLEFQRDNADWFSETDFKVTEIKI